MPINFLIPLLLIPFCSILNHLGGQSVVIPNPRIVCRVFGIGGVFALMAKLSGVCGDSVYLYWAIATAGMALWAVFKWGPMFMAINGEDHRLYGTPWYLPDHWITKFCDFDMRVSSLTPLTRGQCLEWGTLYGTYRGMLMYPMFVVFGFYISPWAFLIGLFCVSQGVVYRCNSTVERAEFIFGAMIGLALATVLIMHLA